MIRVSVPQFAVSERTVYRFSKNFKRWGAVRQERGLLMPESRLYSNKSRGNNAPVVALLYTCSNGRGAK